MAALGRCGRDRPHGDRAEDAGERRGELPCEPSRPRHSHPPPASESSWISDTTRVDQDVVEIARPVGMDAELLQQAPGRRRTSRTRGRPAPRPPRTLCVTKRNVLRPAFPIPLDLVLQDLPCLRVERAERLVAKQDVGVAREGPSQRRALSHAGGQFVRLRVRPSLEWTLASHRFARSRRSPTGTRSSSSASSMLPRTDSHGNRPALGTGRRDRARARSIGRPSSNASPPLGRSSPASTFRIEVLPQPLGRAGRRTLPVRRRRTRRSRP